MKGRLQNLQEKKSDVLAQLKQFSEQSQHIQQYARRLSLDTERALNSIYPNLRVTLTGSIQNLCSVC